MNRLLTIAVALLLAHAAAQALEVRPYSAAALAQAQEAGKPVALHFHADWCPTCRAQEKAMASMKQEPGLDLTVLVANFDTEKALKQQHKVQWQSTLIVFRGKKESARVVADIDPARLRAALKSAL